MPWRHGKPELRGYRRKKDMRKVQIVVLVLLVTLLGSTTIVLASGRSAGKESPVADTQAVEVTAGIGTEQPVTAMQGVVLPLWAEVLLFAVLGVTASVMLSRKKTDDTGYPQTDLMIR